jgi:hypothetical protein
MLLAGFDIVSRSEDVPVRVTLHMTARKFGSARWWQTPSTPRGQRAVPWPHTCTTLEYLKLVKIAVSLSLKPETFRLVQLHQVGKDAPLTNAHPAFSMPAPFFVEARQMPCTAALDITGEVELSLPPRCCDIGRI